MTTVLTASDLAPWSRDAVVEGRLGGGTRNPTYRVRIDGAPLVARRSRRAPASLDWELDLVESLGAHGFLVPAVVPTADGARHAGGLVVSRGIDGRPPGGSADWRAVADELRRLHDVTMGWPARPGCCSARQLLTELRSSDVDLEGMPHAAVQLIRAAWDALPEGPYPVVHGDPGPSNVKLVDGRVALLDWDGARVDCPWFDLAALPVGALPEHDVAPGRAAVHAWEAASGWVLEPSYARWRLGLLDLFRVAHQHSAGIDASPQLDGYLLARGQVV